MITHDEAGTLIAQVLPPGEAVTVNESGAPPEDGVTVTVARPSPTNTVGWAGAAGTATTGATELDETDEVDVPAELVAVTANVYEVALVRPVTSHEFEGTVTVHVAPPGDAVTT